MRIAYWPDQWRGIRTGEPAVGKSSAARAFWPGCDRCRRNANFVLRNPQSEIRDPESIGSGIWLGAAVGYDECLTVRAGKSARLARGAENAAPGKSAGLRALGAGAVQLTLPYLGSRSGCETEQRDPDSRNAPGDTAATMIRLTARDAVAANGHPEIREAWWKSEASELRRPLRSSAGEAAKRGSD